MSELMCLHFKCSVRVATRWQEANYVSIVPIVNPVQCFLNEIPKNGVMYFHRKFALFDNRKVKHLKLQCGIKIKQSRECLIFIEIKIEERYLIFSHLLFNSFIK